MKNSILFIMNFLLAMPGCDNEDGSKKFLVASINKSEYYTEEIFPTEYKGLYGTWRLLNVSGGFSGTGHENNFDYLVIKEIGIYGIVSENKLVEFGKIEREIFDPNTTDYLQVKFVPDAKSEFKSLSAPETYLSLKDPNSLEVISACCDRFNFHFKKWGE